jgi:gamma-glutamylcyclotransferase (GGCT)/AIG2-like uncharacterized protein YtfP
MTRVLVYGTLRQGERAHHALKGCDLVEDDVRVPGFDMYALYGFPGIKENEGNKEGIVGEVYDVNDNTLAYLDYYEGFSRRDPKRSHYVRKTIDVNGKDTEVYVYNPPFGPFAQPLQSGNWKER